MRAPASFLPTVLFLAISFIGCTPETENFQTEPLADYLPLQPGKFITYRLDSTVYTENGRKEEIHSYQEKDVIDEAFLDNTGRTSYRVFRYIRDVAGIGTWRPISTYFITPGTHTIEVIENHMRIVQLALPVKEKTTWKGNQFLPSDPYKAAYNWESSYIKDWKFSVDKTGETVVLNGKTISNVITVTRVDEADVPDTVNVVNNMVNVRADTVRTNVSNRIWSVWIKGNATGPITMNVSTPHEKNYKMNVYNNSNFPAVLNSISTQPRMSRVYEYLNNSWTFGDRDSLGNRVDKPTFDLPASEKSFAVDKFAKGIGLVHQELILWQFEPNQNGSGTSYKVGFGVKRTMLDHN
jgi:hypothetical protein